MKRPGRASRCKNTIYDNMLLTITYTGSNTRNLGYLLCKNPDRPQVFQLNHGRAYVFYPEVSDSRTTAALLLDIDPIDLARGKEGSTGGGQGLFHYVNDRPYVSSSFLSTAISRVYGTAMSGKSQRYQELADTPLDLEATIAMLPCRTRHEMINRIFEPLGYEVSFDAPLPPEEKNGGIHYINLTLKGKVRLCDLLRHLFVLIPVFDRQKHYWIGPDEVEKLLRIGDEWLPAHPEKSYITSRYLKRRRMLVNLAFKRLAQVEEEETENDLPEPEEEQEEVEKQLSLNAKRLGSVIAALKNHGVRKVIDMGCGEGNLLRLLVRDGQFTNIAGIDVSPLSLERAANRLRLERADERMKERISLFQSSLTYKDTRFQGYDAACVIEVIEHMDLPRLKAFERVLFEHTRPSVVVLTTPNREYNAKYENLNERELRHHDHRFEWTREEFKTWATKVAEQHGYTVLISEIGDKDEELGAPTQMGVFSL